MAGEKNITHLYAKVGDRILPKWQGLIEFGEERQRIRFGAGLSVRVLPGGGISVSRVPEDNPWSHPFRAGNLRAMPAGTGNAPKGMVMRTGTLNGKVPWVSEELRVGERDDNNNLALVGLEPQEEGYSWVAVGINVGSNDRERAELSEEPQYNELRIAEIKELPKGMGSGGVRPDDDGWAWHPLVRLRWEAKRLSKRIQITYHNLGHTVVAGGEDKDLERHFFFAHG
jgi:hypothetical protein